MRMEITGTLLTKNWALNLAGQLAPLVVALAAMPYVIHGLGSERFGILSIAWVLLSYSTLLDLGLGRATTKFFAEHLGRDESEKLPAVLWTSVWAQLALGLAGTLLFAAITSPLVEHVLRMSSGLRADTKLSFFILAGSLPIVLVGNAFRAVLEASQRFDLVNYVRAPANASIFLLPAIGLSLGVGLPGIVLLLILARLAATIAYIVLCLQRFPALRGSYSGDSATIRTLLVYGGWVTVSNVVGPLMTYLDRFFIGSIVSVTAVGYYTAPYEAISRATILPGSLMATIFPAFSSLEATGSREKLEELCVRSLKSLLLMLGPLLLLVAVFAHEALQIWLGADFVAKGTRVVQVLAMGTLFNCVASVPLALLLGLHRPDLVAKFHLLEFLPYFILLWSLLGPMGIVGAALAWTARMLVDGVLLFGAASKLKFISRRALLSKSLLRTVGAVCLFGALVVVPRVLGGPLWLCCSIAAALVLAFAIMTWNYLLDAKDRTLVVHAVGRFQTAILRTKELRA